MKRSLAIGMRRKTIRSLMALAGLLELLALSVDVANAAPQDNAEQLSSRPLTLDLFLSQVASSNLDLAAQRYNVSIAQAQVVAAKVSPNPTINLGYASDVSGHDQSTSFSEGLTEEVEVGGKRKFRVTASQRNLLAVSATLDDYFRQLRAAAASAFVDALSGQLTVDQKRRAYNALNDLASANQKRLQEGDIGEVDANQARLDATQAKGDLGAAESTESANLFALMQFLGKRNETRPQPAGSLAFPDRQYNLGSLLTSALEERPDVKAARYALTSLKASVGLAKANRIPDPTVGIGAQQTGKVTNTIDPAPNFNTLNLSVSIPIPVFNSYRGEYEQAVATALQAEKTLKSTELKAEVDVRSAFDRYDLAKKQLAQYGPASLGLAKKVLDAKLTAYRLGQTTLLDVLQAQKDDTDIRLQYVAAITERAKALIALEQACGFWDLKFPANETSHITNVVVPIR
jgi:cobalt-zinc-cadmium efflux system outer membrane protein